MTVPELEPFEFAAGECPMCGHPVAAVTVPALHQAMDDHNVWHDHRLQLPDPFCDTVISELELCAEGARRAIQAAMGIKR